MAPSLITISWVWSITLALPPLLGWGQFRPESNGMSCAPSWSLPSDRGYNIFLFILGFFSPLLVIIYCSVCVIKTLKQSFETICNGNVKTRAMKKHFRITIMVLTLVSVFVFCWAPYAVF